MVLKYATALEALQGIQEELQALRAASSGADWAAIKVDRDSAATKVHELDLRSSAIAGELTGILSVCPLACPCPTYLVLTRCSSPRPQPHCTCIRTRRRAVPIDGEANPARTVARLERKQVVFAEDPGV